MKSKSQLRAYFKERRASLSNQEVDDLSLAIANQTLAMDVWSYHTYHLFLSITEQKEVQTEYLLQVLQGKDKNVVVSKSNFTDFSMSHYLLTDQTLLKKNTYNIPEPTGNSLINIPPDQIDVVFVPLLAVDHQGSRIGYGKGFYDRFLSQCKPGVVKIGLSFFEPISELIEKNSQDIALDYLVTPHRVTAF